MPTAEQFDAIMAKLYEQAEHEEFEFTSLQANITRYEGVAAWQELATTRAAQWDAIADWTSRHGAPGGDVDTFETLANAYRERVAPPPTHISVTLLGDDQERSYPVAYFGTATITSFDGEWLGEQPVALVTTNTGEALIVKHPKYGWCSMGQAQCRDFTPAINTVRLQVAA